MQTELINKSVAKYLDLLPSAIQGSEQLNITTNDPVSISPVSKDTCKGNYGKAVMEIM